MTTTSIEPRDGLTQLAALGYTPAPMIPGGDGVVGWVTGHGKASEFHPSFPAEAHEYMPADATCTLGIVCDGDLIALRASGAARKHLPASPVT